MDDKFWGYHLIIDAKGSEESKPLVTDPVHIRLFCETLVKDIQMIAYGEPNIVHFADHDINLAGYTLVQLIETSNICCHFCDATGDFYLDVFSCKTFDKEIVKKLAREFFKPAQIRECYLTRQA